MSDRQLQETISTLYREHGYLVFRIAMTFLRDEGEAEDCMQEVFCRIIGALRRRPGAELGKAYLRRATTNTCLNRLKRARPEVAAETLPEQSSSAVQHTRLRLRQIMDELPERLREIASYAFIFGYSSREIGELIGRSERTVERKILKIRKRVRDM